jgi:hypothetical protein
LYLIFFQQLQTGTATQPHLYDTYFGGFKAGAEVAVAAAVGTISQTLTKKKLKNESRF